MSDGTFSVRRRQPKASESNTSQARKDALQQGTYEFFLDAGAIGQGRTKTKGKAKAIGDPNEFRVETKRRKRLRQYDRLLKEFKYSAALDSVLKKVSWNWNVDGHLMAEMMPFLLHFIACFRLSLRLLHSL
jgi:U3 small nucleolar RNA-associated protein 15